MKTLKIALASALIVLSLNSFAETCNPCITTGNLHEDSIVMNAEEMPRDTNVNEMLQKMTTSVNQQMISTTDAGKQHHKHNKRKARI